MASPQRENGSTMIANEILEKLSSFPFTGRELRVLFFVIRKTWGWHKKEDKISYNQIATGCSITRRNAIYIVKDLVSKQALVVKEGYINTISFNKDYESWVVSKQALPSVKTSTTLVSKQALKLVPTLTPTKDNKDIITKETNTKDILLRNKEFGNSDINELVKYFSTKMQLPEEDCSQKQSRQYWYMILKKSKTGVDGVKWLIDLACNDDFYKNNISSSKDLYYKRVKLIARKRGDKPKFAVMPTGGELHE